MATIKLYTRGQQLLATEKPVLASHGAKSAYVQVDFDSAWNGLGLSVVFINASDIKTPYELPYLDGRCEIPKEVLTVSGFLFIGVRGAKADGTVVPSTLIRYELKDGAPAGTGTAIPPTATIYQQILGAYGELKRKVDVQGAQIENFTKLPAGSTAGDAELADIRVDYVGKTHNTAGGAVRAQALRIADETSNFEKTITDFLTYGKNANCGWQIGELATADGGEVENNKRARSNFLYAPKGTHFIFSDLANFAGMFVFIYNTDKHYVRNIGVYLPEYLAAEDCYIRFVSKYNDGREITDISAFNNLVEMYFPETIRKNKSVSMNEWYIGALTTKNGGTTDENANKRAKSRFIYLAKNDRITFDNGASDFTGMYLFIYDTDKNYIAHSGGYLYEYTASENCYIRLVSKYKDEREITYPGAFDDLVIIEYDRAAKSYVIGDFAKYFECGEFEGMTDTLPATKIDYIYGRYDALMAAHPEYITKKLLGYATAANGGQDTAYPIYEYAIKADISERPIEEVPTILIQSGIHGDEKSSVYGTLVFFEHMFTSADNVLADIRSGFNFKVIPILNPYGYSSNVRTNARGVDINRNFGYLWDENTSAQKGASPYSELETRILRDWVAENNTALMYIDYHNMGDYNPFISYINTPCEEVQKVYSNFIRRTTYKWRERYHKDRRASVFGWINNDKIPCTYNEAYYVAGVNFSCTLEIAWDENGVKFTKRVIETSFEQLVNFIASMLDYIQRGNNNKGEKGEKGKDGAGGKDGADGKSAYAYAKDGGYTGTEEEFAQALARFAALPTAEGASF
jgi:hypothetical protein